MLLLRRMNMGEKLIGQLIRGNVEDKWEKNGRNFARFGKLRVKILHDVEKCRTLLFKCYESC